MFPVSQDVLFPVEAVVRAGGYVVHQVTAAETLKTGDQLHLHLDQVNIRCALWAEPPGSGSEGG